MAHKIAFIGAGSFGFTRSLVRDLLSFPAFNDAEIALMDINAERLDSITRAVKRIVEAGNYPAKVVSTMDRAEALKGAKGVVTTILHGDVDVWQHDILIPKKYGVDTNVGDTRGPSGIFRYLRTVNPILDIAADIERYCPDAVYLNYTNPMAMLCRAVQGKFPKLVTSGLCHSVQGTASMLAKWIGAPENEIEYTCAGINHQAFYTQFLWNGKDAYPLIKKAITENPEIYNEELGAQRDVPCAGLLRNRVLRPQQRVLRVVQKAPGSDREVLHARHGLESRRVRVHSGRVSQPRNDVENAD